jgi:hypothetical protein
MKFKLGKTAVNLVRKFAPALAAGLGGPVAGQAVNVLANIFGKPGASPTELESLIMGASPEQLADIKRSDQEFELKMNELDIDVFELEIADRDSARELFKINMWPQIALSVIYTLGYFGLIGCLIFDVATIPAGSEGQLLSGLIGVLTTLQIKIADFWFGSSHGSKLKDK